MAKIPGMSVNEGSTEGFDDGQDMLEDKVLLDLLVDGLPLLVVYVLARLVVAISLVVERRLPGVVIPLVFNLVRDLWEPQLPLCDRLLRLCVHASPDQAHVDVVNGDQLSLAVAELDISIKGVQALDLGRRGT